MRTGDVLCPGVDVDAYKANCRVPLFPNQWNVWEVWVSTKEAPTRDKAVDLTRNFLRHVFAAHPATTAPQVTLGPAEFVAAQLGPYTTPGASGAPRTPRVVAATREGLGPSCPVPTVEGPDAMLVTVSFVFRGSETSWPWPTLGNRPASLWDATETGWCPIDAVAVLGRALAPVPGEQVPLQGGIWRNIKDEFPDFSEGVEIVGAAVREVVKGATSRLAFLAIGVGLGAFALWKLGQISASAKGA